MSRGQVKNITMDRLDIRFPLEMAPPTP